jgi:hypothetical protein
MPVPDISLEVHKNQKGDPRKVQRRWGFPGGRFLEFVGCEGINGIGVAPDPYLFQVAMGNSEGYRTGSRGTSSISRDRSRSVSGTALWTTR